jgi:N,N'-diacetylchitobiose transport system permease protein
LSPQAVQLGNESIMLYIFNVAFQDGGQQLGLGSAVNVLLILLIVLMLFPFIRGIAKEARQA